MSVLYPIFPINEKKQPLVKNWQSAKSELKSNGWYGLNVPTGIIVFDLDTKTGRKIDEIKRDIEKLLDCEIDWNEAWLQDTPSGGAHYAFRVDESKHMIQSSNVRGVKGFDIRATGRGYIATSPLYHSDFDVVPTFYDIKSFPQLLKTEPLRQAANPTTDDLETFVHNDQRCGLTEAEAEEYVDALPDDASVDYESWRNVGMAIYHEFGDKGFDLFDTFSRRCEEKYPGEQALRRRFAGFKTPQDKKAITFATVIKMANSTESLADQITSSVEFGEEVNPFLKWSVNDDIEKMESKMLDDTFVLEGLAVLGDWTVIYAAPNTGKTLITFKLICEAAEKKLIDAGMVTYFNCDDNQRGGVEKAKIAREFGIAMVLLGQKDFYTPKLLLKEMGAAINQGTCRGNIVILDTLKKFIDLMDKKVARDFGRIARSFVGAGGTLICLAHVNKHKIEGKSVYSGTSDIRDDADCAWIIEYVGDVDLGNGVKRHTVEFRNEKSRSAVDSEATFLFTRDTQAGYRALFDSVERGDESDLAKAKSAALRSRHAEDDATATAAMEKLLADGEMEKCTLRDALHAETERGKNKCMRLIERYVGKSEEGGLLYVRREKQVKYIGLIDNSYQVDVADEF